MVRQRSTYPAQPLIRGTFRPSPHARVQARLICFIVNHDCGATLQREAVEQADQFVEIGDVLHYRNEDRAALFRRYVPIIPITERLENVRSIVAFLTWVREALPLPVGPSGEPEVSHQPLS